MWRAPVEFDFFAMDRKHEADLNSKESSQRSTINDIQKAMSKIDPQLLKTMFSDGGHDRKPMSAMAKISTEGVRRAELSTPASPASLSSFKNQLAMKQAEGRGTPLTIFYNGGIGKFDVCPDKAEKIIKLAEEFKIKGIDSPTNTLSVSDVCSSREEGETPEIRDSFDLPLARRNSLMAFLDKRRSERLTTSSPYTLRQPNKAGALKLPLPASCRNRSNGNFTSHKS